MLMKNDNFSLPENPQISQYPITKDNSNALNNKYLLLPGEKKKKKSTFLLL